MRHVDYPDNIIKIMNRVPKKIWSSLENAVLTNINSNYSLWPSFIFAPSFVWFNILYDADYFLNDSESEIGIKTENMQALGGFRYTKDIYLFDEDLVNNLIKTSLKDINAQALLRLPEQHLFIDLNGKVEVYDKKIIGFYAYYNDDVCSERLSNFATVDKEFSSHFKDYPYKLCIRVLWKDDEGDNIWSGSIPLKDGDLTDSLEYMHNIRKMIENKYRITETNKMPPCEVVPILEKIIPFILYLCSDEPEIKDKKCSKLKHIPYSDKDKPKRIFSPSIVRRWEVGKEIGKKLRQQREHTGRSSITPHLRRAHWHGFYKGKRDNEERELIYKWIPPIFVTSSKDNK